MSKRRRSIRSGNRKAKARDARAVAWAAEWRKWENYGAIRVEVAMPDSAGRAARMSPTVTLWIDESWLGAMNGVPAARLY